MAILIRDPILGGDLLAERRRTGADRYDEVWEGVYVMPPLPNNEHQQLVMCLGAVLQEVLGWPGLGLVFPGVNVSDRDEGWEHNYRVPDLAVFLPGGKAQSRDTHWVGGPDFAVEITSPHDDTRAKVPFYGQVGVRELLLIDRHPWRLELYRLQGQQLTLAGQATPEQPAVLASQVVPLSFNVRPGTGRPLVEVVRQGEERAWLV
jgi:Uma2 family endonuclease